MTVLLIFALSLLLGLAPPGRNLARPPHRDTAAAAGLQGEVQACPEPRDFALAPSRPVMLQSGAVNTWGAVREALKQWRDSSFRAAFEMGAQDAEPPYVAMEGGPAVQMQQRLPQFESGHTCFFEGQMKDRRNTDFRIAFWFGIHNAQGQKTGGVLEVRWISGIKGSGERSWQPEVPQSGRQAESLARRIENQLK